MGEKKKSQFCSEPFITHLLICISVFMLQAVAIMFFFDF